MCITQLYQFMIFFLLGSNNTVDIASILLAKRKDLDIKERFIQVGEQQVWLDDMTAYCFWLLENSLETNQEFLFIRGATEVT